MSTDHAADCTAFRALHDARATFVIPNPWDAGSARILADCGFKALATTSAGLAFSLGRRDGAMTLDEVLDNARAIVAASPLPVSADLENGYGHDTATVAETMRLAFGAGLAGCSIEDASGLANAPIYGREEAVARIEAAVAAARSLPHPFTLTARAEGFLHGQGNLDEIIWRLQAFERAGADVVYAPGLPDIAAIRAVTAAVRCPVNVLVSGAAPLSVATLAEAGVVRISVGALLSRAALTAVFAGARETVEHGTFEWTRATMPTGEIAAVMQG